MSYRISRDSRALYKRVADGWKGAGFSLWDYYYMCAMTGMSNRRVSSEARTVEFSKTVDRPYNGVMGEMAAALVSSEIERRGIGYSRDTITDLFTRLTDAAEGFSEEGRALLNFYAEGGFQLIRESGEAPGNPAEFVLLCQRLSSR